MKSPVTKAGAFLAFAAPAALVAAVLLASDVRGASHVVHPLTDAEVAAVVVVANLADVKNGELALSRSSNPEVKAFAKTMITDHTAVNAQAGALLEKLGVAPAESDASLGLKASTDEAREQLAQKKGRAFDLAYIANEVAYHEAVLKTLDETLIPSAHNAELKALLVAVRPAFVAHLEHARALQSKLEG